MKLTVLIRKHRILFNVFIPTYISFFCPFALKSCPAFLVSGLYYPLTVLYIYLPLMNNAMSFCLLIDI